MRVPSRSTESLPFSAHGQRSRIRSAATISGTSGTGSRKSIGTSTICVGQGQPRERQRPRGRGRGGERDGAGHEQQGRGQVRGRQRPVATLLGGKPLPG